LTREVIALPAVALAAQLAGLLGVSPYRLRRWKNGEEDPNPPHLFAVLTVAEVMGLRDGVLMCPERDFPGGVVVEALRRRAVQSSPESGEDCVIFADTGGTKKVVTCTRT